MRAWFRNDLGKIEYTAADWAGVRVGFAFLIWHATFFAWNPAKIDIPDAVDPKDPNGLAGVVNLDWLGQPGGTWGAVIVTLLLLGLYVSGRGMVWATGGLLLVHSAVGSIFSSPAKHHHATQIVGIIILGQFAYFLWQALRARKSNGDDAAGQKPLRFPGCHGPSGAIFFSQQMICAGYVVSAISKWVNSGGGIIPGWRWLQQLPNIAVQFEKNHMQAYYDTLQEPSGHLNRAMIEFIANHPQWAKVLLAPGFYLEFFAFVALFNRRWALVFGIGLIAMHSLISEVMHLNFIYFKVILLLYFVHLPHWIREIRSRTGGGRPEQAMAGKAEA